MFSSQWSFVTVEQHGERVERCAVLRVDVDDEQVVGANPVVRVGQDVEPHADLLLVSRAVVGAARSERTVRVLSELARFGGGASRRRSVVHRR
jgi:hypothetical protein